MYLKTNLCQLYFEMQLFTEEIPMSSEADGDQEEEENEVQVEDVQRHISS